MQERRLNGADWSIVDSFSVVVGICHGASGALRGNLPGDSRVNQSCIHVLIKNIYEPSYSKTPALIATSNRDGRTIVIRSTNVKDKCTTER